MQIPHDAKELMEQKKVIALATAIEKGYSKRRLHAAILVVPA